MFTWDDRLVIHTARHSQLVRPIHIFLGHVFLGSFDRSIFTFQRFHFLRFSFLRPLKYVVVQGSDFRR